MKTKTKTKTKTKKKWTVAGARADMLKRRSDMEYAICKWADCCWKDVGFGYLWDEERKMKDAIRAYERAAEHYRCVEAGLL